MTSVFGGGGDPKLPAQQKVEEVNKVTDDATDAAQATRRRIALTGGRESTMLAGMQNILKTRLGE